MIIGISSNIVSALYIVLCDVALPIALTALANQFLSSWNVKQIYTNHRRVQLTSTSLSFLSHQGVSERVICSGTAILSTTIVLLAVAGSFSIDGISRKEHVPMRASVVTDRGSENDLIDFTKQVSKNGSFVSGTFLIARDALYCATSTGDTAAMQASINDMDDLASLEWPKDTPMFNSTCLSTELGFAEKISLRFLVKRRESIPACNVRIKATMPLELSRATAQLSSACPFRAHEFWCASNADTFCVGSVQFPEGFTTYIAQYLNPRGDGPLREQRTLFSSLHSKEKLQEKSIRSMAYLLSTGVIPVGHDLERILAMLAIYRNIDVNKEGGIVEATEINLVLLAKTVGVALALLAVFAIASYVSWRRNVFLAGFAGYNRFCTAKDMMMCVAPEMSNGICEVKAIHSLIIGLSPNRSYAGLLRNTESYSEGDPFPQEEATS